MAGIAGLAAGALAAGVIASALVVPSAGSIGNIIGAGHLRVAVNHGHGSTLDFSNLVPGESRSADQLITGDMAGVRAADLSITLSGVTPGPFAKVAWMTVSSSAPAPEGAAHWSDGACRPDGGFARTVTFASLAPLQHAETVSLGSVTDANTAVCVRFEIGLPASADNAVQGASTGLALTYSLTQTAASAS